MGRIHADTPDVRFDYVCDFLRLCSASKSKALNEVEDNDNESGNGHLIWVKLPLKWSEMVVVPLDKRCFVFIMSNDFRCSESTGLLIAAWNEKWIKINSGNENFDESMSCRSSSFTMETSLNMEFLLISWLNNFTTYFTFYFIERKPKNGSLFTIIIINYHYIHAQCSCRESIKRLNWPQKYLEVIFDSFSSNVVRLFSISPNSFDSDTISYCSFVYVLYIHTWFINRITYDCYLPIHIRRRVTNIQSFPLELNSFRNRAIIIIACDSSEWWIIQSFIRVLNEIHAYLTCDLPDIHVPHHTNTYGIYLHSLYYRSSQAIKAFSIIMDWKNVGAKVSHRPFTAKPFCFLHSFQCGSYKSIAASDQFYLIHRNNVDRHEIFISYNIPYPFLFSKRNPFACCASAISTLAFQCALRLSMFVIIEKG